MLAIVIGDKAEDAFRQAMLMSKGSLGIFFSNTLVTCLIVAGMALLLLPLVLQLARVCAQASPSTDETLVQSRSRNQREGDHMTATPAHCGVNG